MSIPSHTSFSLAEGADLGKSLRPPKQRPMARKTTTPPSADESALWAILESTAAETGERYFAGLVQRLAQAMETCGAWITEYLEEQRRLRALAFWMDGKWVEGYEVDITGTP